MTVNDLTAEKRATLKIVAPWLLDDPREYYRPAQLTGRFVDSHSVDAVYKALERRGVRKHYAGRRCILVAWSDLADYYLSLQEPAR